MRSSLKVRVGHVIGNKMDKTAVVAVERRALEKEFKKYMKSVKTFKVHDEKNECRVGDLVQIIETRPVSRTKRWRVQEILKKSEVAET